MTSIKRSDEIENGRFAGGSVKGVGLCWRFVAATTALFLLFGPYLALLLNANTRYDMFWRRSDGVVLIGSLLLVAAALVAVHAMACWMRLPVVGRLIEHGFVVVVLAGVLSVARSHLPHPGGWMLRPTGMVSSSMWMLIFALTGYSLARPQFGLVKRCRQACQVVSPIVVIVTLQLLLPATYSSEPDPLPQTASGRSVEYDATGMRASPVYVFVLDCWSYERTYDDRGAVRASMPNLALLSGQAISFTDAHSCGKDTMHSIPRLLHQLSNEYMPSRRGGVVGFERSGEFIPCEGKDTIYSAVSGGGYTNVFVGFGIPFKPWLGDSVDVCRTYRWPDHMITNKGGVVEELRGHYLRAMSYWTDPWSAWVVKRLGRRDEAFPAFFDRIIGDVRYLLQNAPRRTFGIFHIPFPHPPFLVNEDGSYRENDPSAWDGGDAAGYERQQAYADSLLGDFVRIMHEAGTFDDALIVVTSDHTWWLNPRRLSGEVCTPPTHVPLVVKLPRQEMPIQVHDTFHCDKLGVLLRFGLDVGNQAGEVLELFASTSRGIPTRVVAGEFVEQRDADVIISDSDKS